MTPTPQDDDGPPKLAALMVDLETVRTRDGKRDFDDKFQYVESDRGERTGLYKAGHIHSSKLRDAHLKEVREIKCPVTGQVKLVGEYVPDE